MMSRVFRRFLAALLAAAAFAAQAGGPGAVCADGTPMKRPGGGSLTLNLDRGNLGARTNAQMATLAANAMRAWNNVGMGSWSTVAVSRGADLPEDVTAANQSTYVGNISDGLNPVIYDTDGTIIDTLFGVGASGNLLGFWGSVGMSNAPCRFLESHMVLNGKAAMDDTTLTNVIAKDIGHFLGLDQTQLDDAQGLTTSNYPLMYPYSYRTAPGLHVDDIAALTALYPSSSVGANFGTFTGTFVDASGAPVLGANIWAENLSTGHLISGVSDYLARRTGEFRMLLTPGLYRLHAGAIRPGFHVGPWSNGAADLSFQPPLYLGGVPMAQVQSTSMFVMLAACESSATFSITGTLTMGAICTAPSEITIPSPNSTLAGGTVQFTWSQAVGPIAEVYLSVGTTPGGTEIFSGYQGTSQLSRLVGGIPVDGRPIYVRLMSYIQGIWRTRDYTFTAATITSAQPSELISPLPDVKLPGSTVTFRWTAGSNLVTSRTLTVGFTPGSAEFYGPTEQGSALERTVTDLPTDGSAICVRFSQVFNGAAMSQDYCYQTMYAPSGSRMWNPAQGSKLPGSSVTFQWSSGYQVQERYFALGSALGASDIYGGYQGAAGYSRSVSGVPADGRTIFARLSSWVGGMWRSYDYTYIAAGTAPSPPPPPAKSNLTSPAAGSTLAGTSATFQWDAGQAVSERYLAVGSAAGASDIYAAYQGSALSRTVSAIPADGRTIYVSLSSWVNGGWQSSTATYTASGAPSGPPVPPSKSNLTSPSPGSTLSGSSVTFGWDEGSAVNERYLAIGSTAGASDIFGGYQGTALSRTVSTLPTDGRTIYVSLSSWVNGGWQTSSATFTAASSGGSPTPSGPASEITSPVPGTPILTSAFLFQWSAGTGVTERYLAVGRTPGGSDIYAGYQGASLSRTVTGMTAAVVYVRLMSYIDGMWVVKDYTFQLPSFS